MNQSWLDDKTKITQAIKIQELLDLIDLKRSNLLTIDDFFKSLESNEKLKILMKNDFVSLTDKLLKSNSSNGNYLLKSTKSKHVVTNIKWLSDLIESIPQLRMDTDLNLLKNNVPVLSKHALNKELSTLVPENKVTSKLFYLNFFSYNN